MLLLIGLAFAVRLATRLARAEAMQSLLVDELNHRVKNTLQTVQSIAAQTFRNAQDIPDALHKFDGRVVAMGRANEPAQRGALAQRRHGAIWSTARSSRSAPRTGSACMPSGPRLPVAPQSAVMISMMLHELATNAAKYGALVERHRRGVHRLASGRQGGDRVQLNWRETGGPPVAAPERKGFGTTLIQRGLTAQLGGSAEIEFAPTGLRCTLECPVR